MHRVPETNEKPPLRWLFRALSSVTESVSKTVLYFRVANRVGGNGRFLRGFPMWSYLGQYASGIVSAARNVTDVKTTSQDLLGTVSPRLERQLIPNAEAV